MVSTFVYKSVKGRTSAKTGSGPIETFTIHVEYLG